MREPPAGLGQNWAGGTASWEYGNSMEESGSGTAYEGLSREELVALLEHRDRQIEAVRRTGDALFSHPNVESMVRATLLIALHVLRADAGTLFLHDPIDNSLVFRYVVGPAADKLTGVRLPSTQGGVAWTVFRTHEPTIVGDVANRVDFNNKIDKEAGYHTESMMTVPVKRTDGDPIGVMQVLNARVPFTRQDLEVLQVLCASAATGIEHARLAQEARKAEIVHVIGDISHDIKNMLTPILTGVWTLEPMFKRLFDDLDAVRSRCPEGEAWGEAIKRTADVVRYDYGWMLENILHSADQVQARTKEIADAVKGEMSPPFFEQANLNETCEAVSRPLKVVADKAGITLQLDLDRSLPLVEYDRKQLYNAIYNLINNAIPETPAGGTVTVRTIGPKSPEDRTVTVQVQDTGRGMPEHVRVRLFTDEAISTKPGGTGLGTRIVAGVVRRHNGRITVDSEPGVGCIFTITLPLRHQPD